MPIYSGRGSASKLRQNNRRKINPNAIRIFKKALWSIRERGMSDFFISTIRVRGRRFARVWISRLRKFAILIVLDKRTCKIPFTNVYYKSELDYGHILLGEFWIRSKKILILRTYTNMLFIPILKLIFFTMLFCWDVVRNNTQYA